MTRTRFDLAAIGADLVTRHPFPTPADAQRIARAYGTEARRWLGEAQSGGDPGQRTKLDLWLGPEQQAVLAEHLAATRA